MKTLILTLALLGASLAQAQAQAPKSVSAIDKINAQFEKCAENAASTYDMNTCASKSYKAADAELNRVYQGITAEIKKTSTDDSKETLSRLVKSERAWVLYRDTECSLQGVEMLGGSGEGPVVGNCLVDQTVKRVKDLQNIFGRSDY